MRNITIDGDKLKEDLMDYFGTAMFAASPMAMMELSRVENARGDDLIQIALDNGFDLEKYAI
jgi:cyanate lyase